MDEIWNLSALCRCCHADGNFRSLSECNELEVKTETFADILTNTFGVNIMQPSRETSYSICDDCIQSLLQASHFKLKVQECEIKFSEYWHNEQIGTIKVEELSDKEDETKQTNLYKQVIPLDFEIKDKIKDEEVKNEENGNTREIASDRDVSDDDGTGVFDDDDKNDVADEMHETLDKTTVAKKTNKKITENVNKSNKANTEIKKPARKRQSRCKTAKPKQINEALIVYEKTENSTTYSCKDCGGIYEDIETIKKHIQQKHPIKPYFCTKCSKSFSKRYYYDSHIKTHACFKTKICICDICGKELSSKNNMIVHLLNHIEGRPLKCHLCSKPFKHNTTLKRHLKMHAGIYNGGICDVCGRHFNSKTNMIMHKKTVHEKLRPYQCDQCDKKYSVKKHLRSHKVNAHSINRPKFECDICYKKYLDDKSFKRHKQSHDPNEKHSGTIPRVYYCRVCEIKFKDRKSKLIHSQTYHYENYLKFVCDICQKGFSSKYILNRHILTHDPSKQTYPCVVCHKMFSHPVTLKRHQNVVHNPSRRYMFITKCSLCKMNVRNIEKHMKSHNQRNLPCDQCDKFFSEISSLNRHKKCVHSGVKKFECSVCDKKYMRIDSLNAHMLRKHCVTKTGNVTEQTE